MSLRRVVIEDNPPSCGKMGYQTRREAAHWKRSADRNLLNGAGLNIYKCHRCGLWHLGHRKRAA